MQYVDLVVHVARVLDGAESQVRLGKRFQNLDLRDVVRAFIDVRDVHGATEGLRRKVGSAAFQLCGPEAL